VANDVNSNTLPAGSRLNDKWVNAGFVSTLFLNQTAAHYPTKQNALLAAVA